MELGECIAAKQGLGHSCRAIAGTLCGGTGTEAQKKYTCILCEVYQLYHRTTASAGKRIRDEFPEQDVKYNTMLRDRMKNR